MEESSLSQGKYNPKLDLAFRFVGQVNASNYSLQKKTALPPPTCNIE